MINKEFITRKDSKILYFVFGVPMLVLIGFVVYTATTGPSTQELIATGDLAESFTGRVDSLYFDERNHNGKYAVLDGEQICPIIRPWEQYVEVGDSLSKKQGSFLLEVYKRNHTKMTLDYRDTYKKRKIKDITF
ncbi:hypothetical protein ACXZ1K_11405 [Pedobacter sp. PWIIR3]